MIKCKDLYRQEFKTSKFILFHYFGVGRDVTLFGFLVCFFLFVFFDVKERQYWNGRKFIIEPVTKDFVDVSGT